jgi:uncharacterized OB-fold protein
MSERQDWTTGTPALLVSRCRRCEERWYLPRQRCRACRSAEIAFETAAGGGVVVAVTNGGVVGVGDGSPGGIALVDLDEGVRVMTTCTSGVSPGSRVQIGFADVDGRLVPRAVPAQEES